MTRTGDPPPRPSRRTGPSDCGGSSRCCACHGVPPAGGQVAPVEQLDHVGGAPAVLVQPEPHQKWRTYDLAPVHGPLIRCRSSWRRIDRRVRQAAEDHPAQGPGWGPERQIRSQVLFQLLSGRGEFDKTFGTPMAVRVRGAQVMGRLNLGGLTLRCPMELYECYLGGRLDLAKSKAADISLRGSRLACRLSARRLRLDHNLNLERLACQGGLSADGLTVGGQLSCAGATLTNEAGPALSADGIPVDGGLFLSAAIVTGEVRLLGAHIGGQLDCEGATLTNEAGPALNGDRLAVA